MSQKCFRINRGECKNQNRFGWAYPQISLAILCFKEAQATAPPPNLKSCTKLCLANTNVGIYSILKCPIIQGAHMFRTSRVIAKLLLSREPGTHCLCMLSYSRISGALETSGYLTAISRPSLYYRSLHSYNCRWWCFQKSLRKTLSRC